MTTALVPITVHGGEGGSIVPVKDEFFGEKVSGYTNTLVSKSTKPKKAIKILP